MCQPHSQFYQLLCFRFRQHLGSQLQFLRQVLVAEYLMVKEPPQGDEIFTGVEVAKAQLPDDCQGSLLHAVEQIDQIAVEVVVHLKGGNLRLSEKDTAGAAEYINEPAVFQRKQCIEDMEDSGFVSNPRYRGFNGDHLSFVGGINRPIYEIRRYQSSRGD